MFLFIGKHTFNLASITRVFKTEFDVTVWLGDRDFVVFEFASKSGQAMAWLFSDPANLIHLVLQESAAVDLIKFKQKKAPNFESGRAAQERQDGDLE